MVKQVNEIPKCRKHNPVEYGFDLLGAGDPPQIRSMCPHCGNTGLALREMGMEPYGVIKAVVRCIDGN